MNERFSHKAWIDIAPGCHVAVQPETASRITHALVAQRSKWGEHPICISRIQLGRNLLQAEVYVPKGADESEFLSGAREILQSVAYAAWRAVAA